MDIDPVSAYPRHYSFNGVPQHLERGPSLQRCRYASDPTLVDPEGESPEHRGRRSAQDDYSRTDDKDNIAKEARKQKKKKLKRLRTFVHVFLGGLRKGQSVQVSSEQKQQHRSYITTTRYQQRDERDGATSNNHRDVQTSAEQRSRKPPLGPSPPGSNNQDIPGLCGLYNHGNTCFMNAILQCLSNTDQLAEFFVTDQYKNELNRQRVAMRRFGTAGDVTEQLALLLKCLWNGQYNPRVTSCFKDVVGRHAAQYQGSSQHDAQEFFLWLLDNVHEDLNQAAKKKYRPIKDGTGRPDEEVAAETLRSHLKSNNSFIQGLFQGQFRSAILCPSCGTRSCTFDPYVCVSLPIPQRDTRPVYVTVVYRSSSRQSRVFGVNVGLNDSIRELRNSLAELCGINRYHLVMTDLNASGFQRTFYDDQRVSVITSNDLVFGFECPPYRGDNPEAQTPSNPSGSKELMLMLVVNKFGQTQYGKRFGPPLILRVWRDLTHSQFQSVVLKAMSKYLREGVRLADVCRSGVLFRGKVLDGLPGRCVLPTDVDHPFYSPSVDKALHVSMLYGGPAHIKLVAEWEPETKASVFGVVPDQVPDPHSSVMELRQSYQQPMNVTLSDCLGIYTQEETLNREDSWFCPHCKQEQVSATKKITLWTLPDVLVVHLKRFRQVGFSRTKLNTLVKFPLQGLDMTPYLAGRGSPSRPSSATLERHNRTHVPRGAKTLPSKSVRFEDAAAAAAVDKKPVTRSSSSRFHFPWRKHKKDKSEQRASSPEAVFTPDSPCSVRSAPSVMGGDREPHHHSAGGRRAQSPRLPIHSSGDYSQSNGLPDTGNTYDLYAICNHHGSMTRGHYTAFCRNPANGQWYVYDDMHIQPLSEEKLITPGAYMMFYVRQSLLAQTPLSSSDSSTSSSSQSSSHWIYHIPQFRLDLGSTEESSNDSKSPRPRLGSANSAVSAPPTAMGRGVSPPSSSHDNDDVFSTPSRTNTADSYSAVSLPPYSAGPYSPSHPPKALHRPPPPPPPYNHRHTQLAHVIASPAHNRVVNNRHASMRLGRVRQTSPPTEEPLRRGASFHTPGHHRVQRLATDTGIYDRLPHQTAVLPTRSIPNMPAEAMQQQVYSQQHNQQQPHPFSQPGVVGVMPSRSIPNMAASDDMTSPAFLSEQLPWQHRSTSYKDNSMQQNESQV